MRALEQNDPATQSCSAVEPVGQYDPELHAICVEGFEQKDPAAQAASVVDRGGQYDPYPQATFVEGSGQKEPAGQAISAVGPKKSEASHSVLDHTFIAS